MYKDLVGWAEIDGKKGGFELHTIGSGKDISFVCDDGRAICSLMSEKAGMLASVQQGALASSQQDKENDGAEVIPSENLTQSPHALQPVLTQSELRRSVEDATQAEKEKSQRRPTSTVAPPGEVDVVTNARGDTAKGKDKVKADVGASAGVERGKGKGKDAAPPPEPAHDAPPAPPGVPDKDKGKGKDVASPGALDKGKGASPPPPPRPPDKGKGKGKDVAPPAEDKDKGKGKDAGPPALDATESPAASAPTGGKVKGKEKAVEVDNVANAELSPHSIGIAPGDTAFRSNLQSDDPLEEDFASGNDLDSNLDLDSDSDSHSDSGSASASDSGPRVGRASDAKTIASQLAAAAQQNIRGISMERGKRKGKDAAPPPEPAHDTSPAPPGVLSSADGTTSLPFPLPLSGGLGGGGGDAPLPLSGAPGDTTSLPFPLSLSEGKGKGKDAGPPALDATASPAASAPTGGKVKGKEKAGEVDDVVNAELSPHSIRIAPGDTAFRSNLQSDDPLEEDIASGNDLDSDLDSDSDSHSDSGSASASGSGPRVGRASDAKTVASQLAAAAQQNIRGISIPVAKLESFAIVGDEPLPAPQPASELESRGPPGLKLTHPQNAPVRTQSTRRSHRSQPTQLGSKDLDCGLTCMLCQGRYDEPKLLPCLHSYCRRCLHGLLFQDTPAAVQTGIECPECHRPANVYDRSGVDGLPSDFWINRVIDIKALDAVNVSDMRCDLCDDGVSVCRCVDCAEYLCAFHREAHAKTRKTKQHTLLSISEFRTRAAKDPRIVGRAAARICPHHNEQELTMYCEVCERVICRDCLLSDHREHRYSFLAEAAEAGCNKLESLQDQMASTAPRLQAAIDRVENENENVTAQCEDVKRGIDEHIDMHIMALEERRRCLHADRQMLARSKSQALTAQNYWLSAQLFDLKNCLSFAERVVAHGDDVELLSVKRTIESRLIELTEAPEMEVSPCEEASITFRATEDLLRFSKNYGAVVDTSASAAACTVHGEGLTGAVAGEAAQIIITALSRDGTRLRHGGHGDSFHCQICAVAAGRGTVPDGQALVSDNLDGTYLISYTAYQVGPHMVSLILRGEHVAGSPYSIKVWARELPPGLGK
jgi:hypothetical protein